MTTTDLPYGQARHTHGTLSCYKCGCHCELCRAANARYVIEKRHGTYAGKTHEVINPAEPMMVPTEVGPLEYTAVCMGCAWNVQGGVNVRRKGAYHAQKLQHVVYVTSKRRYLYDGTAW